LTFWKEGFRLSRFSDSLPQQLRKLKMTWQSGLEFRSKFTTSSLHSIGRISAMRLEIASNWSLSIKTWFNFSKQDSKLNRESFTVSAAKTVKNSQNRFELITTFLVISIMQTFHTINDSRFKHLGWRVKFMW
jgi:hypothetical protein